jgi:predicted  nucleic acid-binding Zn-ribbon protein
MEDTMHSEADAEVHFGFSEEERQDLHKLISTLSDERSLGWDEGQPESTSTEIDERIRDMSSSIEDFSERMLQLDDKMRSASSYVDERMRQMGSSIAGFSEKLLKLDAQMKAFYKILLLSQKRTELMNKHIDAILEMILDGEGRL